MTVTYHVGDTRKVVAAIPDGSIDLIASSPPFLAIRDYLPSDADDKADEIGKEANPAAFIDTLLELTAEWGRLLTPHGSIAIELGDTYAGSGGAGGDYNLGGMREGQEKFAGTSYIARQDTKTRKVAGPDATGGGIANLHGKIQPGGAGWPKAKSLVLIPELYAVALAYGINPLTGKPSPAGRWLVRNVIVWHRPNPAPGALADKVRPSTSYITVATRSAKRWYDLTAVRGEGSPNTHARTARGVASRPSTGKAADRDGNFDTLATLHSTNGAPPLDCWFDEWDGTHETWTLTTQASSLAHYAMWPARLAERLILMMCPAQVCRVCGAPRRRIEQETDSYAAQMGDRIRDDINGRSTAQTRNKPGDVTHIRRADTVGWTDCGHDNYRSGLTLDPFAGTGTTLAVADIHGRDAVGIDLDARNRDLYQARLGECRRVLFGVAPELPGQLDMFGDPQ